MRFCPNIASRNELAGILPGDRVYVLNAKADPEVDAEVAAMYIMLPSMEWSQIGNAAPFEMADFVAAASGLGLDASGKLKVAPGGGMEIDADGKLAANPGAGLGLDEDGKLAVEPGDGLAVDAQSKAVYNLAPMFNTEEIIDVSGDYTVKVTGWHEITIIDGGNAGAAADSGNIWCNGGHSGNRQTYLKYLRKGEIIPVSIGAGGIARPLTSPGKTSFGSLKVKNQTRFIGESSIVWWSAFGMVAYGGGPGGGAQPWESDRNADATWYGGGGGAYCRSDDMKTWITYKGNGYKGAAILRYFDAARTGNEPDAETEENGNE